MIRILIADDQKAVHWLLKSFLEHQKNVDLVATADNGKTAVELVDRLRPDVVLLDLCMPIMDGLSATKLITKSYQQTKIIIFSSQESEQFIAQTIIAGANGYLLKKYAGENISEALRTVCEGKYYLDPQLEAANILNHEVPGFQSPQLDNWAYFIAKEVINIWRFQSGDRNLSVAQLIADLGLATESIAKVIPPIIFDLEKSGKNISLFKKLSTHLDLLQRGINTRTSIEPSYMFTQLQKSELEIKDWFTGNSQVEEWSSNEFASDQKIKDVIAKVFAQFEANITILLRKQGSKIVDEWLQELDKNLHTIQADYKHQYQNQIQKATSAWSAFYILSNELASSKKKAGNLNNWLAVWKALLFAYKFQLYALLYSYALEEIITEMIRRVRDYQSIALRTDNLLLNLHSRFSQNINTKINLAFFSFEQTNLINPIKLRQELESCIGYPFVQWGTTDSINYPLLEEWLIARIKPLANQYYLEQDHLRVTPSADNFSIQDRLRQRF